MDAATQHSAADWREEYAYTLGLQAYIFGFPYVYLPALRWSWVTQPKPPGSMTPFAPLNHFYHARTLADADYRDGGCPNQDTLYSIAWVDLRDGPVILSHPEMGDRYFTFEMAGIDSDNFAYVGKRTTGTKAGSFAIVGPGWRGELPAGVMRLPQSRTRSVLILGRTLVDGPADIAAVVALQDQYTLTPLALWGKESPALPARRDVWPPANPKSDPLAEWKTMNRAMTEDPPEGRLAKLVELFATIGVGPDQDITRLDEATQRGLARAAASGRQMLNAVIRSGALGSRVNGWNIPPKAFGRAGIVDDFLLRASLQCLGGIIANDPEEAIYVNTTVDGSGQSLDGSRRYRLRFAPGQLPPVDGFWSLSLYDPTYNFTANSIDRYAIGDRTPGLTFDSDGGLTLCIQAARPEGDHSANWLPCMPSGMFSLVLRAYIPRPEIIERVWVPPPVLKLDE